MPGGWPGLRKLRPRASCSIRPFQRSSIWGWWDDVCPPPTTRLNPFPPRAEDNETDPQHSPVPHALSCPDWVPQLFSVACFFMPPGLSARGTAGCSPGAPHLQSCPVASLGPQRGLTVWTWTKCSPSLGLIFLLASRRVSLTGLWSTSTVTEAGADGALSHYLLSQSYWCTRGAGRSCWGPEERIGNGRVRGQEQRGHGGPVRMELASGQPHRRPQGPPNGPPGGCLSRPLA